MSQIRVLMLAVALGGWAATEAEAQVGMIATPAQRAALQSTPIVSRPNRPGHFYGNTVRRIHQRRMGR